MPGHGAGKTSEPQKQLIEQWIAEGFTDSQITDKIAAYRERGDTYEDEYWPAMSRQNIRYYREKMKDRLHELQSNTFDVAISTGLARKQVMVRRAVHRAGRLDTMMDLIEDELFKLVREGVISGETYLPLSDDPSILEAEWTVDGSASSQGRLPAKRRMKVQLGDPAEDPRYKRFRELLPEISKLGQSHERYLSLIAKITGMQNAKIDPDDKPPAERRKNVEDRLNELLNRAKVGVSAS